MCIRDRDCHRPNAGRCWGGGKAANEWWCKGGGIWCQKQKIAHPSTRRSTPRPDKGVMWIRKRRTHGPSLHSSHYQSYSFAFLDRFRSSVRRRKWKVGARIVLLVDAQAELLAVRIYLYIKEYKEGSCTVCLRLFIFGNRWERFNILYCASIKGHHFIYCRFRAISEPVSYTHLTLPTILLV